MTEQKKLSREEIAAVEVGRTDVSPVVAKALSVMFLTLIVAVPAVQNVQECRMISRNRAQALKEGKVYDGPRLPQCFEGLMLWPSRKELASLRGFDSFLKVNSRMLREINEYEDALENNSNLQKALIPPAQRVLTGWLKGGNEKAYCGRDGWLFFRPGVDYLTGRGFLDERVLAARSQSGNEWTAPPQPDPVKAIVDFKEQLAERGIELVLLPTPVKPMIHPEKFSRRFEEAGHALQNPSFGEFKERLAAKGVKVFDPAPILIDLKKASGKAVYLESDTHWTPEAMQSVVKSLADFVSASVPARESTYRLERKDIENMGDIAFMLKLPEGQTCYKKQKVTIARVRLAEGKPWVPDEEAEVLVLGDSFSNIYSLDGMNWGSAAGFVEHISAALGRPVDRITINDNGAFASRANLGLELAKGRDRLAGKKVVIWQFAARELAVGDWKLVEMKLGESRAKQPLKSVDGLVLKGKVAALAKVPVPGQVPYKDATFAIHLTDLQVVKGAFDVDQMPEILVYTWVMRHNKLTPMAKLKPGQLLELKLEPWERAKSRVGRYNRLVIDDPMVMMLDEFWAEE